MRIKLVKKVFSTLLVALLLTSCGGMTTGVSIGETEIKSSEIQKNVDDILTEDQDIIFNESECNIYVDQESLNYLKGSMVDYSDDGLNKGIKFHNPNAKAVCGCGESFTI